MVSPIRKLFIRNNETQKEQKVYYDKYAKLVYNNTVFEGEQAYTMTGTDYSKLQDIMCLDGDIDTLTRKDIKIALKKQKDNADMFEKMGLTITKDKNGIYDIKINGSNIHLDFETRKETRQRLRAEKKKGVDAPRKQYKQEKYAAERVLASKDYLGVAKDENNDNKYTISNETDKSITFGKIKSLLGYKRKRGPRLGKGEGTILKHNREAFEKDDYMTELENKRHKTQSGKFGIIKKKNRLMYDGYGLVGKNYKANPESTIKFKNSYVMNADDIESGKDILELLSDEY